MRDFGDGWADLGGDRAAFERDGAAFVGGWVGEGV